MQTDAPHWKLCASVLWALPFPTIHPVCWTTETHRLDLASPWDARRPGTQTASERPAALAGPILKLKVCLQTGKFSLGLKGSLLPATEVSGSSAGLYRESRELFTFQQTLLYLCSCLPQLSPL